MRLSNEEKRITVGEKICFGMGDFAINGLCTFVFSYLMFFYTDYVKISLGLVSSILVIGRVVDAISGVCFGRYLDRRESELGKCRPLMVKTFLPLIGVSVFLFFIPAGISDAAKGLMAMAAYIVFSILYASVNIPYSTMLSVMTDKEQERISFNVYKNVGSGLGAVLVTATTLSLAAFFEKHTGNGYTWTMVCFATVFGAAGMTSILHTRERNLLDPQKTDTNRKAALHSILHNKPYLIFCAVQFMQMTYILLHNQATIYYAKFFLEDEKIGSILLTLTPFACILVAFILPEVVRRIGLARCVMLGNGMIALSLAGTIAAGKCLWAVVVMAGVTSLGWGFASGMIFVIISKTITYAEAKDGVNLQGMMTSIVSFLMKLGVATAGFLGPLILKMGGYSADLPLSDSALSAIRLSFIYIPMFMSLVQIVLMHFFDIPENMKR